MATAKPEEIQWPLTPRTLEAINTNFDRLFRLLRGVSSDITRITTIINTPTDLSGLTAPHDILDGGTAHLDTDDFDVQTGALIYGRGTATALNAWADGQDSDLLPVGLNESGQKYWVDGIPMVGAYDYTYAWTRRDIGDERDYLMVKGGVPVWETDPIQPQDTGFTIEAGTIPILVTIEAPLTVEAATALNQDVKTTSTPTFVGVIAPFIKGSSWYPPADASDAIQVRKADGTTPVVVISTNTPRLGIGTTPTSVLEVWAAAGGNPFNVSLFSNTSGGALTRAFKARGTGTAPRRVQSGDTLAGINAFGYYAPDDVTDATVAATSTGRFIFSAAEAFTSTAQGTTFILYVTPTGSTSVIEGLRIDGNGNVGVGVTAWGTSAARVIGIANGTPPSDSPADMVQLFAEDVAASSELRVRDEGGTVTTLSPHNFSLLGERSEPLAWSHYSRSRAGDEINVDMLRVVRLVEWLTGEQLVKMQGPNVRSRQLTWGERWRRFVCRFLMRGCPV